MDNIHLNSLTLTVVLNLSGREFKYFAAEYVNECRPYVVVDSFGSERMFVPLINMIKIEV